MSHPIKESMTHGMGLALQRAGVGADQIDYVNAHATSTVLGDIQEAQAIAEVFPHRPPVSSLKGHFGHSLAACGTIEAICSIEMMQAGLAIANRNLHKIDPECTGIDALQKNREGRYQTILSNNFAFGGMNTSFILTGCG
jgi:3-oxoacyl-[acyl-carrier-protein] synthase II